MSVSVSVSVSVSDPLKSHLECRKINTRFELTGQNMRSLLAILIVISNVNAQALTDRGNTRARVGPGLSADNSFILGDLGTGARLVVFKSSTFRVLRTKNLDASSS